MRLPRRTHVPSSRFFPASTACSTRSLQVCCTLLPVLGFASSSLSVPPPPEGRERHRVVEETLSLSAGVPEALGVVTSHGIHRPLRLQPACSTFTRRIVRPSNRLLVPTWRRAVPMTTARMVVFVGQDERSRSRPEGRTRDCAAPEGAAAASCADLPKPVDVEGRAVLLETPMDERSLRTASRAHSGPCCGVHRGAVHCTGQGSPRASTRRSMVSLHPSRFHLLAP